MTIASLTDDTSTSATECDWLQSVVGTHCAASRSFPKLVLLCPDERKEFLPRFRILPEHSKHGASNSLTVGLLYPSHSHTHVATSRNTSSAV